MKRIGRRTLIGAGLAAALAGKATFAQTFPTKQIRWIIPFAPGGNYDVTSRLVSEPMGRQLGQSILIDNKPGAGGVVGLELAYNAPADGYTIVMASFTVGYVAPLFAGKKEMLSQFAPVSIGHSGNGTTNHVSILRLQLNDNLKFNIIPYRGSGPGIADLLAGNVDSFADQLTSSMPHIKSGKLRPLGTLGLDRIPDLPNVPTLSDLGLKPFDGSTTAGVFAHAGTPKAVVARLNEGVVAGLKDETANRRLRELGAIVRPSTPEQFTAALKADEANVSELLKLGLLKPE